MEQRAECDETGLQIALELTSNPIVRKLVHQKAGVLVSNDLFKLIQTSVPLIICKRFRFSGLQ